MFLEAVATSKVGVSTVTPPDEGLERRHRLTVRRQNKSTHVITPNEHDSLVQVVLYCGFSATLLAAAIFRAFGSWCLTACRQVP